MRRTTLLAVAACWVIGCSPPEAATPPGAPTREKPIEPAADPLAAEKERTRENLKLFAAAAFHYERAYYRLPAGFANAATGRPALSWRVQILPYLSDPAADDLYKQFNLDEPWDSPTNLKLLARMPAVFAPVRGSAPEGHTFYQTFTNHILDPNGNELPPGERIEGNEGPAVFPDPRSLTRPKGLPASYTGHYHVSAPGLLGLIDGTDNVFYVVEAGEPVPWTKPQNTPYRTRRGSNEPGTWPALGGMFDGNFHAVTFAGTVHYVRKDLPADKLAQFIGHRDSRIPDYEAVGLVPGWKQREKDAGMRTAPTGRGTYGTSRGGTYPTRRGAFPTNRGGAIPTAKGGTIPTARGAVPTRR